MAERITTLEYNGCTIRVHRPELNDAERAKREEDVKRALSVFMQSYIKTKEVTA